jgi:hypothetical protein
MLSLSLMTLSLMLEDGASRRRQGRPQRENLQVLPAIAHPATASDSGVILVRDTTNRSGGTLEFTAGTWAEFTASLQ